MNDQQSIAGRAGPEQVYAYVRVRVAFEQMVLSVLYGALLSAALVFVVQAVTGVLNSGFGAAALLSFIVVTVTHAFVVFLAGFLSAVIVGVPLFQFVEARKLRQAWPFFAAALFVEMIFWFLALGGIPDFVRLPIATSVSLIAPGVIIAALFARRMRPVWRQAENAERAPPAIVVRYH